MPDHTPIQNQSNRGENSVTVRATEPVWQSGHLLLREARFPAVRQRNMPNGRSYFLSPVVEVHRNVGVVFLPADIQPLGDRLSGAVKGIHVGHRARRQDALVLAAEHIGSYGQNREKSLLLPQRLLVFA